MKKRKNYSDEIDLSELFLLIKKNVLKIIFITTIASVLGYFYALDQKIMYKLETEVRGISNSEEIKYEKFNSYLKKSAIFLNNIEYNIPFYDFQKINKNFLFNLFIDRLYNKNSLIEVLKKSELISKENYQNSTEYEKAIEDLSSKITLRLPQNERNQFSFIIEINTTDKKKWANFLIFIDKFINKEIQNEIKKKFANQFLNEKTTKEYQIEDLQNEISILSNMLKTYDNDKSFLNEMIKLKIEKKVALINLKSSNHLERIKFLFDNTPVVKSNDFYAAKVLYSKTKLYDIKNSDKNAIIIAFAFVGFISSFFLIYILNGLNKRY